MSWLADVFGVDKPVIAMCHLDALPGDPGFDRQGGMGRVVARAAQDIAALEAGGVDAIMISNEFSLPYLTKTEPITAIAMARVIGELRDRISVPFGVNVLWDPIASVDLAVAAGARFVREIFTGVYASDYGLWNTSCGEAVRHRSRVGGDDVRLLFNVVPESASYLGERRLADIVRSTVFNARPDALCVSGLTAGAATDEQELEIVKTAAGTTPVFVNTGVTSGNVARQLAVADGAVVGTFFKRDGVFENEVDPGRVETLMIEVHKLRGGAAA